MAKAATLDEPVGMERADIKRHLRFAREEAISVAFAVGGDGKAIIQLDKRKPGRALERQLKEGAPDSKSHRWGTALIDPSEPKTVRFTVNKAGGGLARKLIVALKGTGFSKVKICLDDGTELESHEEADEEDSDDEQVKPAGGAVGAAAGKAAGAAEAGAAETGAAAGAAAGEAAGQAEAPQQAAGQFDAAALAKDLTGLVKRMLGVISKDSTQKAALTELATDAQVSLKRGDLEQASAGIDIFREAIKDGEAGIAGGAANGAAAKGAAPNGAAAGAATGQAGRGAGNGKDHHAGAANGAAKPANGEATPDIRKEAEQILAALTDAVKKTMPMIGVIPGLGELVKTVVPAVQAAIKQGDTHKAQSGVQQLLEAALKGMGGNAAGDAMKGAAGKLAPNGGGAEAQNGHAHREHAAKHAPAIDKASSVWGATRNKVMGELQKLEQMFTSALDGHGMADDLTKTLRTKVEGTLHHLDDRLMHALAAVNKSADAAERAKHVEHAHSLIQHYQKHVSGDKTIKMLDTNPFMPLSLEKMVLGNLAALARTIR